ncbi:Aerobic respiration control sensor protein ArcB [compost metagenome]
MNGVIGMIDLLLETELQEEQKEYAEIIRNSANTLVTIINDILDFTKMESGKMELEESPFELRAGIQEVFNLFSMDANRKGLELVYFMDDSIPQILYGDMGRIRQVLINLIANGIKFTDQGGIYLVVSAGNDTDEKDNLLLEFTVKDTGIGIAPDKVDKLFKPFSQLDSSMTRKYGGTGLGLAICQTLVQLMGGDIRIEPQEEKGATFTFSVQVRNYAEEDEVSYYCPGVSAEGQSLHTDRMLVVDDHPINQRLMVSMLNKLGYEADVAEDGAQAVQMALEGEGYSFIFMDLQMPVMDGLEATRRIRDAHHSGPSPVIIAMTANIMEGIRSKCLKAGMNDYISKPVKLSSVRKMVAKYISGSVHGSMKHFPETYQESVVDS